MRLGSKLGQKGARTERWEDHHNRSRSAVRARANGRCEGCGEVAPLDWCHLAGRRHIISEPWCSSPELTAGLCRRCHRAIDGNSNVGLRDRLRIEGAGRLMAAHNLTLTPPVPSDPLDVIRAIERHLVERGDGQ